MTSSRNSPLNGESSSKQQSAPEDRRENRRARRRREKEKQSADAESSASTPNRQVEPSATVANEDMSNTTALSRGSFDEADFIAFTFSDEEERLEEKRPVREWDKGKGRAVDRDSAGQKRKAEEIDYNDGYASKKQRVAAASRKAPWVADVDWEGCSNVAEMLHRDVDAFVKYISPTPEEDEVRSLVVALITRAVTRSFPDAQVLPFGSYETKLYLPVGDIDLVINSQSMAYSNKETVLHALANTMKRAGVTDRVKIIAKAKVPIVKFITMHGNFSVDISINQVNGVAAGKMIKHFLAELPALRSLVLVIKSFLSQRSMNEVYTGGLGSYSIVCLAISFLQMHPKIRRGEIDPDRNLGVLIMEFFELYGLYFNYHEVGISLRDGGTYFNKAQRGWLDFGQPKLLSIEDPGDPSNDISRGSYGIAKVRTTLAGAHGIMTAAAYMQSSIIGAKRAGRHTRLRDTYDPEELSILASVMGVTQETINHRRLVQEVYDRRVLQRMLGITPQQAVLKADLPPPTASGKARMAHQESVKSAWEEADMEVGSEDDAGSETFIYEDESRYQIDDGRQPPKKRRKRGRAQDPHTIYTSDDEEAEENGSIHLDEPDDHLEYNLADLESKDGDQEGTHASEDTRYGTDRSARHRRRRDFWLSKGCTGVASDSD